MYTIELSRQQSFRRIIRNMTKSAVVFYLIVLFLIHFNVRCRGFINKFSLHPVKVLGKLAFSSV